MFLSSDSGGFDALVGNPPFVGGKKLTGLFGTDYRDHLVLYLADGRRGSADLCAYFFLRGQHVLRPGGCFGLLAVNTIAEGDTRQVGLEAMLRQGIALYAARPNFEWPGAAAVLASAVHGVRGSWQGIRRIHGATVPTISAFLSAEDEWSPKPLDANTGKSYIGSFVLGMGFTMTPDEAQVYIKQAHQNTEALFPFLNGEDLNSHPEQQASRWVINFWDWPLKRSAEDGHWASADERQRERWLRDGQVPPDYPDPVATDFPSLLRVVESSVKPERQRLDEKGEFALRNPLPQRWWQYADKRPALYHAIGRGCAFARHPEGWSEDASLRRVFAICRVTKYVAPAVCDPDQVFSDSIVVFAVEDWSEFSLLASSFHEVWARKNSSTLETRLRYLPSEIYETLPRPLTLGSELASLGEQFASGRSDWCNENGAGLTDFYNALHEPGRADSALSSLREVLAQIDHDLLAAYNWSDLSLDHGFHEVASLPANDRVRFTISEAARLEVLRRLAALNRQRYREEQEAAQSLQSALEERSTPRKRAGRPVAKKTGTTSGQPQLFD